MVKKKLIFPACFAFLFLLQGCNDSNVDLVKNGNFPDYPNATIGQILDSSFDSTEWSSDETSKGEIHVNFEGKISAKMHNTFKDALFPAPSGGDDIDVDYGLQVKILRHLPYLLGEDKIARDFMLDFTQDCSSKLYPSSYEDQETLNNDIAWMELRNQCAATLEKVINETLNEFFWKEGDIVYFSWVIQSGGRSFELSQFGGATILPNTTLKNVLYAIYSIE